MNIASILILTGIGILFALASRYSFRHRGECGECGGNCSACGACSRKKDIRKSAERK